MADVPKQEQIRRLNEKLRLFRRTALDVGDAGDCLFEAACEQYKQLPDQPPLHFMRSAQALREMIASWCRANREALAKSPIVASLAPDVKDPAKWDSYCKKIAKPREWGDQLEILAIASLPALRHLHLRAPPRRILAPPLHHHPPPHRKLVHAA